MRRKILALLAACTMMASPLPGYAAKNDGANSKKSVQKAALKKQDTRKAAVKNTAKKSTKPVKNARSTVNNKKIAAKAGSKKKVAQNAAHPPARHIAVSDDPAHLAIQSAAALVLDQTTGKALVEKQPDAVLPIASISKLMTAMVVLDAGLDLNEVISIGHDDVDDLKGTRSRLPVGTTMTRETAMLLALMSSENRAANALGRHYPGGLAAFVAAMNRKSRSLGMFDSRFEEPTGLSSNNVSTAHDLARMVAAAARYPEIRMFSTTAEAKVALNGRIQTFGNTNALVRSDNWQIGVSKTGYISEAGRCLVMQAWVADKPVVIVLLDSQGKMTRVGDANRIKRWMESAALAKAAHPA
ncbi:D-alanyl-D-alanine endopeptidase [Azonexus sp.]|uniref:D-alanyl-D-alanine endopeptidase n=1 Tax=Azonexus sp. TaxID=1872668 RepID=UPI0039E569A2